MISGDFWGRQERATPAIAGLVDREPIELHKFTIKFLYLYFKFVPFVFHFLKLN